MTYQIVVGVDGSPHSTAALHWSLDQAASRGGAVTAVLAWQLPFVSIPGAFDRAELEQGYREFLARTVSAAAPAPAVPLDTVLAEGDPAQSLVSAATEAGAAVLVLGIRGRSPVAGLMMGSVSQACAASAPCPVVLVKRPDAG